MTNKHGDWIWYELMTPDADAATGFYGAILGWKINNPKDDGFDYREVQMGSEFIGGVMPLTPEMTAGGAVPAWVGYVAVDDVDASVAAIEAAGGRTCMPARDMEGVGRFAMMFDPQGAPFYVMTPTPPPGMDDYTSTAFAKYEAKPGHCAWNELATSDPAGAIAFYGKIFGWTKDGEMDMGPMGKYEFVKSDVPIGAIMPKMPQMPVSAWGFYFRVPDIDKAMETVKSKGGQVIVEPMEIPGGEFSINAVDPQGAHFGLVGPRV